MNQEQWKNIHRLARQRLRFSGFENLLFMRDERGFMGVTKRHEKGHIWPPAAIANKLRHAANDRGYPIGHACFIEHVRLLRRFGTWFGK